MYLFYSCPNNSRHFGKTVNLIKKSSLKWQKFVWFVCYSFTTDSGVLDTDLCPEPGALSGVGTECVADRRRYSGSSFDKNSVVATVVCLVTPGCKQLLLRGLINKRMVV